MTVRAVPLALLSCLLACASPYAMATDAATRAAEERALRAQIERTDHDIQQIASRLYELEKAHPGDPQVDALRAQVHAMDRDQELIEKRLRELEKEDPHDASGRRIEKGPMTPASASDAAPSTPAVAPIDSTPPPPPPPPPPPSPPPAVAAPRFGPALRQAADPAAYAKAAGASVGVFHYRSYKWVPVGTRQLAIYNTYDEAFLLDFAADCPGLLSTQRIQVESFSTKVKAGRDGVVADGQRCAIADIRELNLARLPR